MTYDPTKHHRRSIRLKGYDYSQPGYYFVTICTQNRSCLLGNVVDGEMVLNAAGQTMEAVWYDIPVKFPTLQLDEFGIMPNHTHLVVQLTDVVRPVVHPDIAEPNVGQAWRPAPTRPALSDVVQWYKSMTTTRYRHGVYDHGWTPFDGRLWQRDYYEHIIRNEVELNRIRAYIRNNPANWANDEDNPASKKKVS